MEHTCIFRDRYMYTYIRSKYNYNLAIHSPGRTSSNYRDLISISHVKGEKNIATIRRPQQEQVVDTYSLFFVFISYETNYKHVGVSKNDTKEWCWTFLPYNKIFPSLDIYFFIYLRSSRYVSCKETTISLQHLWNVLNKFIGY